MYGPIPARAVRTVEAMPRTQGELCLPERLVDAEAAEAARLAAIRARYAWYAHPEGPWFVETHRDPHRTSGHWLFERGVISAFHRVVDSEELWLAHEGTLLVHVLDDSGHRVHRLGSSVADGETPVVSVPKGSWQAAEVAPGAPFAFGTNVCAPPFTFERSFDMPPRRVLAQAFPSHLPLVERLTYAGDDTPSS